MGALGKAILVMSIVLVFVPLVGGYATLLLGVVALFVRGPGVKPALIGVGVNALHVLFLSDFIRFNATSGLRDGVWTPVVIYVGLILVQLAAGIVLGWRRYGASTGSVAQGIGPSSGAR
ncbi:MAG: hypothetical protein H7834_14600 [Magnetococcus sp. YQC-9]